MSPDSQAISAINYIVYYMQKNTNIASRLSKTAAERRNNNNQTARPGDRARRVFAPKKQNREMRNYINYFLQHEVFPYL